MLENNQGLASINDCHKHLSLCDSFGEDFWVKKPSGRVIICKNKGQIGVVTIYESGNIFNHNILQVAGEPRSTITILDAKWIGQHLPKQWKAICEKSHRRSDQSSCLISQAKTYLQPSSPQYFVDTWLRCLAPASSDMNYITLSYVWGQVRNFTTTKATLARLQKPGAFIDPKVLEKLPNTIKDAINLVEYLGERYLWIDALCIVQDDDEWKYQQIDNMASIFANSHLTIIAEDGDDANYGLRGLRGISKPRNFVQKVHKLTSRLQVVAVSLFDDRLRTPSRWGTRGWTFQEDVFSTRRLRFHRDMVQWECNGNYWREERDKVHKNVRLGSPRYLSEIFVTPFPSLSGYVDLIQEYGKREFTNPEDALFAFSGITTVLNRTFSGGFIAGLPSMFLDIALLWQPTFTMRRRTTMIKSDMLPCLPSWSWVGWIGPTSSQSWDPGQCYIKRSSQPRVKGSMTSHRVIPIVQWSVSETLQSTKKQVFRPWEKYQFHNWDDSQSMPQGWTRHQYQCRDLVSQAPLYLPPRSTGSVRNYFKHEKFPDTEFWHPIPLNNDVNGSTCPNARYLSGRTQRAWLYNGSVFQPKWNDGRVLLNDRFGDWAGILGPNDESSKEITLEVNLKIELIAISKGLTTPKRDNNLDFEEWVINEQHKSLEIYNFYHVMWIGWDNGVAYRKALGRVPQDIWERQELEWIDVTIG
ncbi:HET-domain-containing protein [Mollisia scopiformis]|uniref:HET-domain-containing protein n=1 Tax=Mollisia scopiformis TaxID=149040 RepID=A0A194WUH0_MOLSC|nr:HET-domain-containing protein [Mollisia scopiformis]KUJ11314.1 HET-domain-containing protein [Mollisia scopiformis]